MSKLRFVGLDVHAETIAVAVAEADGEVRSLGTIPNRPESVRKLIGKLGPVSKLKCCYEAGPTGYVLYWQLTRMGVACEVIAPSLVPVKAGDRVKTDRRDAEKLARCYRAGELTAGVGSGCGPRSTARSGAGARSGQEGSASRPAPAGKVSAAPRQAPHGCRPGVDQEVCGLDSDSCPL